MIPYDILCSETKYPGTLNVTESRQYRTHGLIHVSDQCYEFALKLEDKRINGLNSKMMKIHRDKLVGVVEAGLLNGTLDGMGTRQGRKPDLYKGVLSQNLSETGLGCNQSPTRMV